MSIRSTVIVLLRLCVTHIAVIVNQRTFRVSFDVVVLELFAWIEPAYPMDKLRRSSLWISLCSFIILVS